MSSKRGSARTFHPQALSDIGETACLALLGIAADLRRGAIPPAEYDQRFGDDACGSPCCILGWLRRRWPECQISPTCCAGNKRLRNLFWGGHPSDPALAADAIERYVFGYAARPWSAAA